MDTLTKILNLINEKNIEYSEIEKELNIHRGCITDWKTLRTKSYKKIIPKIAEYFGVSTDYLLIGKEVASQLIEYNPQFKIPILGKISAGMPLFAEEQIEGYTTTNLNGGGEYFALRVQGDSMNAVRICENDILIIRKQSIVENGEIAVVMVDNENATVKKFYKNSDTITLIPQSTNAIHQPQIYNIKDTKVTVIGRVIKNEINFN